MADTYNIFISWSGERSERVAKALYDWLPMVLQTAKPWMSKEDIEKGSRGLEELGKALETMSVGIICLTPENVQKPWIHFEAGALSRAMGDKTRVCPYLFGGLRVEQVGLPLGIFQATGEGKEEARKMMLAVNRALGEVASPEAARTWFEREWPTLEKRLTEIPALKPLAPPQVDEKKMVAQLLELVQAGANSDAKLAEEVRALRKGIEMLRPSGLFGSIGGGNLLPWVQPTAFGPALTSYGTLSEMMGGDLSALRTLAKVLEDNPDLSAKIKAANESREKKKADTSKK